MGVLYLPGTNCHRETLRAFDAVGAEARLVLVADLLRGCDGLATCNLVCIPGGFAYGDHMGAGTVAGALLRHTLARELQAARARPMLCICNGFQIAVRAGVFGSAVTLTTNLRGTFVSIPEQPHVVSETNDSLWLRGLAGTRLIFPCAHGEGRFVYTDRQGWETALRYPVDANPDGSTDGIAGITSADGLVLGLMNHPERLPHSDEVMTLFENGVRAARAA